ncbi:MAG TPA: cupin domain-containing protein [Syntrophales bacterium]|jgi:quercetin dioxygenase-like cupin family protein|nr:cupin domain-containing protein [Syntrophaceae bacterium]NLX31762.1 cupin domain-containing protein [Deltaproteobacteria bacterium]HNU84396.1 cupin domain-containing protein [Syntrophales bacterium]HNZ35788.1 cupin domain-containing protein [Syntrophales bacterium]HOF73430.1 cupin domain-containing protein [Syntrophales bacterium]
MVTTIQEKKESLVAKALDMTGLVEYQAGSVVSRAVIQKKTGTVTLFAFDEGQGLSEHTAPFDALVCLLDGQADIVISGKSHVLKQGEMIIMPAGEPHSIKAIGPFKMMLVMIRG